MGQDNDREAKRHDLETKTMIGTVPPRGLTSSPSSPSSPSSTMPPRTAHHPRPRSGEMPATLMVPPGSDGIVGQVLGNYTVRRKLAEGGMGVVYEGEHRQLGRLGAIKVLKLELCGSEDMVERFRHEALAVSAIRHENIVEVFDFGRDREGRVFFVMEYLDGEPLSARIARGALGWGEAFPVLEQT